MISLDNMLFFIFTKKRLLAGVQSSDQKPEILPLENHWFISYEGKNIPQVLEGVWKKVLDAYNRIHGESSTAPIAISLPANLEEGQKRSMVESLNRLGGKRFSIFFEDQLASSFAFGLKEREELEGNKSLVLEALDDYLNLWQLEVNKTDSAKALMGKEALASAEEVRSEQIKEIGPSTGRSRLLAELIKKFQAAGLSLNLDSQTSLAHQLINPSEDFSFSVVQESENVVLQGEASFEEQQFEELFAVNREQLAAYLSADRLNEQGISHVFLIGEFFQNKVMKAYLNDEIQLGDKLVPLPDFSEKKEYQTMMRGLASRAELQWEAEKRKLEFEAEKARKREEEEKKRQQLKAELEAKDARESLFEEIKNTCTDPTQSEEYEQKFIPMGEQLGIPDVVIKWNISEILSKISLTEKAQSIGILEAENNAESENMESLEEQAEDLSPSNGQHEEKEPASSDEESEEEDLQHEEREKVLPLRHEENPKAETAVEEGRGLEKSDDGKEDEKVQPAVAEEKPAMGSENSDENDGKAEREEEVEPVFVLSPAERSSSNHRGQAVKVNPVITFKEEDKKDAVRISGKKQHFSLGDIFSLKSELKDGEFLTRVVSFKADSVLQTLRLLKVEEMNDLSMLEAFKKLHLKEMDYYGNVSDISESREGLYYYRPYIERSSLKDYLISNGFNKKEKVENLSSNELKFMLMVFKEVRSLSQPHAALNEDNIIILEKRKWGISKNVEVTFVGFTSEDVSNNEMVEATHTAFSRVMGEAFYKEFRKKFQL